MLSMRVPLVGAAAAALLFSWAAPTQAQSRTGVSWGAAIPFAGTQDFTDDPTIRNFALSGSIMRGSNAFGIHVGWTVFDAVVDTTQAIGDAPVEVNGRQYRSSNMVPVLLTGRRHFGSLDEPHLFAGAGIGTVFTRRRLDVGILNFDDDAWRFAFVPEVGFETPAVPGSSIYVVARYHLTNESDGIGEQFLSFNIGVRTR